MIGFGQRAVEVLVVIAVLVGMWGEFLLRTGRAEPLRLGGATAPDRQKSNDRYRLRAGNDHVLARRRGVLRTTMAVLARAVQAQVAGVRYLHRFVRRQVALMDGQPRLLDAAVEAAVEQRAVFGGVVSYGRRLTAVCAHEGERSALLANQRLFLRDLQAELQRREDSHATLSGGPAPRVGDLSGIEFDVFVSDDGQVAAAWDSDSGHRVSPHRRQLHDIIATDASENEPYPRGAVALAPALPTDAAEDCQPTLRVRVTAQGPEWASAPIALGDLGHAYADIGRDHACRLVLPETARGLSRQHLRLSIQDGRLLATDRSTYGSWMNSSDRPLQRDVPVEVELPCVILLTRSGRYRVRVERLP